MPPRVLATAVVGEAEVGIRWVGAVRVVGCVEGRRVSQYVGGSLNGQHDAGESQQHDHVVLIILIQ